MAKASIRKPVATVRNEGAQVIRKLRRDAEALVARGRAEVMKDVRAVRSSADRAVRELERRVVRQFHAATEGQLKRLERRVAKLERLVAQISAKTTEPRTQRTPLRAAPPARSLTTVAGLQRT